MTLNKLETSRLSHYLSDLESFQPVAMETLCFVLGYYIATDSRDSTSLRALHLRSLTNFIPL